MTEKFLPQEEVERQWYSVDRAKRLIHAITANPDEPFVVFEELEGGNRIERSSIADLKVLHALKINLIPTLKQELVEAGEGEMAEQIVFEAKRQQNGH